MKGSKNDYATFTGAIPASGSWQPGKTNPGRLVLGILLAWISKPAAEAVGLLGTLFVGALKAVAPILVLMLVMASIANHQHGQKTNIRPIFVPLSAGHLLCCSGRSNLQFCLPFYPALVQ